MPLSQDFPQAGLPTAVLRPTGPDRMLLHRLRRVAAVLLPAFQLRVDTLGWTHAREMYQHDGTDLCLRRYEHCSRRLHLPLANTATVSIPIIAIAIPWEILTNRHRQDKIGNQLEGQTRRNPRFPPRSLRYHLLDRPSEVPFLLGIVHEPDLRLLRPGCVVPDRTLRRRHLCLSTWNGQSVPPNQAPAFGEEVICGQQHGGFTDVHRG